MSAVLIAGANVARSAVTATAQIINNPDGLTFIAKVSKVALPAMKAAAPAFALSGICAANNLILGSGGQKGLGLEFFADRFSPITYGVCGLSTLLNWGSNPMDPLTDAAFLGSITGGFGLKRVLEIFNRNVDSPSWKAVEGVLSMSALGGLAAVVYASFHLKSCFQDSADNYKQDISPKVWGSWPQQADQEAQPVWAAKSRATYKLNIARANYTLWIGMIALPFLRASGASLPIFKNLNYKNWTLGINAIRGALWIAGAVIGADLVKVKLAENEDEDMQAVLPEYSSDQTSLDANRASWNNARDTHFAGLNYGAFDWFREGISFIAEKSTETHSWACRFTKLPQAGLLTAELFFESIGNIPWAAFTGNAARNLRAWRKMGKVAKVITQPVKFIEQVSKVGKSIASNRWTLSEVVNVLGSATFSMMYDWGSMTSFVATRAGYPLQGRVKSLFDNASKRWCCIPMAFSLVAQAHIEYKKGRESAFAKVFFAARASVAQSVLGSQLQMQEAQDAAEAPNGKDYRQVANFVSQLGLTALTTIAWYRGGSSKGSELATSLFDGLGAASGISEDWTKWLGERKDSALNISVG